MTDATEKPQATRLMMAVLAGSVGAVATCGIVYQLIVGTVSTYLEGNSTYQFSLTIGLFMSAYGLGSFLSTRVHRRLFDWFVGTEIALGFFGGISTLTLFYLYGTTEMFGVGRVALILVTGTFIGLEIPLLMRIFDTYKRDLRLTAGQIMGFDYIGALIGGIGFPLLLLPAFGLMGSAALVGLVNVAVAGAAAWVFRERLVHYRALTGLAVAVVCILGFVVSQTREVERDLESHLYEDPVTYLEQTPYQRIVMSKQKDDLRLYLDGSLQFSTADEYRYHESLVHPAATRLEAPSNVLVLGGGDGLALRELNMHDVERVVLVDLDPAMVRLGKEHPMLVSVNRNAFDRPGVEVRNEDALKYLETTDEMFDLIIVDLPDPHHESLAKLYSVTFYRHLLSRLKPSGLAALQLGSPFFANRTYWGAVSTMREAGWTVKPYHIQVPSFGIWGFALAGHNVPVAPVRMHEGRFFDSRFEDEMFRFPKDLESKHPVVPNTLFRPVIVEYFRTDWRSWN